MKYLHLSLLLPVLLLSDVCAETIVRMELQQGSKVNNVDLKLFNSAAPLTAASFLKYADAPHVFNGANTPTGSYSNTFIHGITTTGPQFVLGGKFSYTPAGGTFECANCTADPLFEDFMGGLQLVTDDAAIPKEVFKPHVRATIAMEASDGGSSPNEWHINITDNNTGFLANLFTVFGEVINDTMSVVDGISTNPDVTLEDRTDIHFSFNVLPLVNEAMASTPLVNIAEENLVKVNSVKRLFAITSDIVASISADTNFGVVFVNTDNQAAITIENTGENDLTITDIASSDVLAAPFSIALPNNCIGATLNPSSTMSSTCTFMVDFNSVNEVTVSDSFNIEFSFAGGTTLENENLSYSYTVAGQASTVVQPVISPDSTQIDFGNVQLNSTDQQSIRVTNTGTTELVISALNISGVDAAAFTAGGNCLSIGSISPAASCQITMELRPDSLNEKLAVLTIDSNDPDQATIAIQLKGSGDKDADGIAFLEEEAGPNGGDNNNDGVIDSQQSNVASFITVNKDYFSLVTEDTFVISSIKMVSDDNFDTPPVEVNFNNGVFEFEVVLNQLAAVIEVGFILPKSVLPDSYYLFGSTDDNVIPHWFRYSAVQLFPNSELLALDGSKIARSIIKLIVQDGGPGDADGIVNGVIKIGPGAPSFSTKSSSGGSGVGNPLFFVLLITLLVMSRPRKQT